MDLENIITTVAPVDKSISDTLFKMSPPLLMIIGINISLMLLRHFVPHKILPIIAVVLGMVFTPLLIPVSSLAYSVPSPMTALIIMGAVIGYAAVGLHQKFKQILKKVGVSTGDTMIITKEDGLPKGDIRP